MKLFTCSVCQQVLFFENIECTRCGHALAYLPDRGIVSAIEPLSPVSGAPGVASASTVAPAPATHVAHSIPGSRGRYRLCRNYVDHAACTWAIPEGDPDAYCLACRFNDVIPNLSDAHAREAWPRLERAKRRLFYTLIELGLPLETKAQSERGLAFSFLQDTASTKVFTGHSDGLITINVAEAEDPFREKMRLQMGETYRTVLGHFRHEIGHYYWSRLIDGTPYHDTFRAKFGDERADYDEALERHYSSGGPPNWSASYVSAYASMHPWEDWAETWAHYLHMVDTLETARSYGLGLPPKATGDASLAPAAAVRLDVDDFDDLIRSWVPLTVALNSLNRAMGLPDAYPFVLTAAPTQKLRFVHEVIAQAAKGRRKLGETKHDAA